MNGMPEDVGLSIGDHHSRRIETRRGIVHRANHKGNTGFLVGRGRGVLPQSGAKPHINQTGVGR